jgi:carbon storage regulator CsrA
MLVLSRRVRQKLLFPGIDVAVSVLSVKGGVVRLGVKAPPGVAVLRAELGGRGAIGAAPAPAAQGPPRLLRRLCDRLRVTGVGLGAVQLLLDAGRTEEGRQTLARIRDDLQLLRVGVEGELEEAAAAGGRPSGPAPRALLVEDDRDQRELLAGLLRLDGFEVDTAGDGCDALDYLRGRPRPDVVLMDLGLPRCDGATAVRALRGDPAQAGLRIFAVSGSPPEAFGLARGPAGVDRWFAKPVDPPALLHDLRQELGCPPCGA